MVVNCTTEAQPAQLLQLEEFKVRKMTNELRNGWIYFNNRGIIKNVKLPEYGKMTLTIVDGVITYITTETQTKL